MPIGLDPLCLPAPCSWYSHQLKAKVASPLFLLSTFLFSFSPHYVVCQLTSHLQLHKALGITFILLITYVCQHHIPPPIHTHALSQTHAVGLRFGGSYDTIQIHLAAYSGEVCFALSYFPQKSRFSLPSSFDPHGTGGLCQQSCVLAWGPSRPWRCHSLLSVIAGVA